jgi:hypothetical protein
MVRISCPFNEKTDMELSAGFEPFIVTMQKLLPGKTVINGAS